MKQKTILIFISLFTSLFIDAQELELKSREYYTGTLKSTKVEIYIKTMENPCPMTYITAIYKRDKKYWDFLNTSFDLEKGKFIMSEAKSEGVYILKKKNNKLIGWWISDNGEKIKIELNKNSLNKEKIDELEEKLENANYMNNDC